MTTKIFIIIMGFINPQEQEAFEFYKTEINKQYEQVGAVVTDRYPVLQVLAGEEKPDFVMVVEFPSPQALQQVFASTEYQKLVPYREKGFSKLNVFLSTNNDVEHHSGE